MFKSLKKLLYTDNFSYFIRYFAVFTLIFVSMTTIIFQLMRSTMYHSTDETLKRIQGDSRMAIGFAIARSYEPTSEIIIQTEESMSESTSEPNQESNYFKFPSVQKSGENMRLGMNTHVLLYRKDGAIINPDNFSGLSSFKLDKKKLGDIKEVTIETPFGASEDYRYITIELSEEEAMSYASYEIQCATVLINVSQIKSSIVSYEQTVIIVMTSFWIISILASIYLANVSMRPLLISYQKQKDFVENASHELRTPLAVLQNRLESLFRHPEATILESSESIGSSLEEVRNMRMLTTNLLNLARRDDGLTLQTTVVNPEYFDEMFENFAIIAEENNKKLQVENFLKDPIRTDKVMLKQLLTILFDNAMKYSEENGSIYITASKKDKFVYFTIADDGLGIPDEHKKKIFDRFYRIDKARTRQKGGFGLGLSLAKQIIDTFGGQIRVKDNRPKGTIFEVRLPK